MPDSEEKGEEAKSSGDGKPPVWSVVDSSGAATGDASTSAVKKEPARPKDADGDQNGGAKPEVKAEPDGEDHDDEDHYNEDEDDEDGDEGNLNSKWEETFKRLQAFKERHGHCLVPNRYQEDPQLGSWVSTQRRQYKIFASGSDQSTPMTAERARRLEGIGFQWSTRDPRHVPWEKRYGELLEFIRRFGHAQVPIGWKENVQLSNWVSTQRQEYKLMQKGRTTRLTQDRIDLLNKVNFVWEAQRGGPRRHRRATVSVPPKANPVQKAAKESRGSTPSSAGRGGKGGARGGLTPPVMVARSAPASAPQPSGTGASQSPDSQPQPAGAISLGPQGNGAAAGANAQMAFNLSAMNAAGAFPPGTNLAGVRSLADLGMFGQPGQAMMGQPWHMLPNGAFQQQGPMGLGIFPIATPLPIAAAGYQLGMIPTSLVEGGANAFLRHPMFAGAAAGAAPVAATTPSKSKSSKKKKRKSHGKTKKKKKKKKKAEEEEEEEEEESESEEEEEEEEEEDDDEESE